MHGTVVTCENQAFFPSLRSLTPSPPPKDLPPVSFIVVFGHLRYDSEDNTATFVSATIS